MTANNIQLLCESNWGKYKNDCSGFVKAVSNKLGIQLSGQANAMIDIMNRLPWIQLGTDISEAIRYANQNYLVIAGLKKTPHGHVAIIMPNSSKPYPTAYWGRLGSSGKKNTTINWSWNHHDLKEVEYFAR